MSKPENTQYALNLDEFRLHTFTGVMLGAASSEFKTHNHDEEFMTQSTQERCSACRWQEVKLFRTVAGEYLIYTVGRTIIPGEKNFIRLKTTESAFEIVELLTVRRDKTSFLPVPAARALAQAAQYDDDVREAYVNRAVV